MFKEIKKLTDEEILKEFFKRFECEGAILIYLTKNKNEILTENFLSEWESKIGKDWAKRIGSAVLTANQ
jgi:hypothetical protein